MKAGNIAVSIVVAALLGSSGYLLYTQAAPYLVPPCKEPLTYTLVKFDERFGLSQSKFETILKESAALWSTAAGRELFVAVPEGEIDVSMVYGEKQQAVELGNVIDAEQAAYEAKKEELEGLKREFNATKRSYEARAEEYDKASAEYHADVQHWNSEGGAPPDEYARLEREREELQEEQRELKEEAAKANDIVESINDRVDELNVLAKKLNAKVNTYNQGAGEEFEQGDYQQDAEGKRINLYEFASETELRRVLAHEFGHALGIDHVENPESIMYSYNVGSEFELSAEDVAALRAACKLKN